MTDTPAARDAATSAAVPLETHAHRFLPATGRQETLLILHGTGGNEDDLLPLGELLAPGAARLSPRGRVLEHGKPRFFARHAEGVLDQADLAFRTTELSAWVRTARAHYGIDGRPTIAVGFSNGANIAASMLLRNTGVLRGAILLAPMLPFEPDALPDLSGIRVFIGAGRMDPLVPAAQSQRLADVLRAAGAEVELHWTDAGHSITPDEVEAAQRWIG